MRRRAAQLVGGGGPWRTALLAPVAVSGERRERSGEREGASREERKEKLEARVYIWLGRFSREGREGKQK
jgi:hypothetical protein